MRSNHWTADNWALHLRGIQIVWDESLEIKSPDYRVYSSIATQRLENSTSERCQYVLGLLLAMLERGDIAPLEDGKPARALAVIGNGPTAVVAASAALELGIPVVMIAVNNSPLLAPLRDARHRWICPRFYRRTIVDETDISHWTLEAPQAFQLPSDLEHSLCEFQYGHEPASEVAQRFLRKFEQVTDEFASIFAQGDVSLSRSWKRNSLETHKAIERANGSLRELELEGSVTGVLHCRFAEGEPLAHPKDEAKPVAYTSFPYWERGNREPWISIRESLLFTGGGDGAQQDRLRAVCQWDTLEESIRAYKRLFTEKSWSRIEEYAREIDRSYADFKDGWLIHEELKISRYRQSLVSHADFLPLQAQVDMNEAANRCFDRQIELWTAFFESTKSAAESISLLETRGDLPKRNVYLHSPRLSLGPCYPHNLLFTLVTLILAQEKRGKLLWIDRDNPQDTPLEASEADENVLFIVGKNLDLRFDPGEPAIDRTDPLWCLEGAISGNLSAAGIDGLGTVVIRHGPVRYPYYDGAPT